MFEKKKESRDWSSVPRSGFGICIVKSEFVCDMLLFHLGFMSCVEEGRFCRSEVIASLTKRPLIERVRSGVVASHLKFCSCACCCLFSFRFMSYLHV